MIMVDAVPRGRTTARRQFFSTICAATDGRAPAERCRSAAVPLAANRPAPGL